ncbi:MAG: xanthine dehydrogenase family protein subunit M [Acidobacteria bacterium]|nr:xanthine dehydrogenase family protein subunit M [Betaproteobacteria bacterium]MBI2828541.1 xanthine dehydrogenase family protein subunit M [Acidobacteriota bacterium]
MSYTVNPVFEHYYQPKSVEETVALLAQCGKEARVLAGGTVLINQMRSGAVAPRHVINISRVAGLDEVRVAEEGELAIGALATLAKVARSSAVRKGWPLLHETMLEIGVVQQRNLATVVGNLCRPVPSADTAVALLVLEASVLMSGAKGRRRVTMSDFLAGPRRTMMADSEMVTEVRVPPAPAGAGTAFVKLHAPKVNAAAFLLNSGGGCSEARIALGGVAQTPIRVPKAEALLRGAKLDAQLIDEAGIAAQGETSPASDLRAGAEYRREMSRVLVARALEAAWNRTKRQ